MNVIQKIKNKFKKKKKRISASTKRKLSVLQELIKYRFKDLSLLVSALTHDSIYYSSDDEQNYNSNYERLEFLGDAILGLIVCQHIFNVFPDKNEGELSKMKSSIVSEKFLALKAENFRLAEFVIMSEKEERNGGREKKSIIADAVESVICAIYLDGGLNKARKFVTNFILNDFEKQVMHKDLINYKSILQEFVQSHFQSIPEYRVNSSAGPAHQKMFKIVVHIDGHPCGYGEALNKKEAQQQAAYEACQRLRLI